MFLSRSVWAAAMVSIKTLVKSFVGKVITSPLDLISPMIVALSFRYPLSAEVSLTVSPHFIFSTSTADKSPDDGGILLIPISLSIRIDSAESILLKVVILLFLKRCNRLIYSIFCMDQIF